jgi:hypothetical protein
MYYAKASFEVSPACPAAVMQSLRPNLGAEV